MRRIAVLFAAALSACAPAVTSASRDEIFILHDPAFWGANDLQPQADEECSKYGRKAVFTKSFYQGIPGMSARVARFDCTD